jgi:very-short-patch-repair endonuclease
LNKYSGCPACKHKNEKIIFNILKENNIEFTYHKDIRKLNKNETRKCYVDFYISKHNLIIEYNGRQHYQLVNFGGISREKAELNFVKQQSRDTYIRNFCQINKINLLEIDGRIYANDILYKYIIDLINSLVLNYGNEFLSRGFGCMQSRIWKNS